MDVKYCVENLDVYFSSIKKTGRLYFSLTRFANKYTCLAISPSLPSGCKGRPMTTPSIFFAGIISSNSLSLYMILNGFVLLNMCYNI
jgi:hypothetical protein